MKKLGEISLDKLARMRGKFGWTGKKYRTLMKNICEFNSNKVSEYVGRGYLEGYSAYLTRNWKRVVLPDFKYVMDNALRTRKAVERGKLMTDNIRGKLSEALREVFSDFHSEQGEPQYVYDDKMRRGRLNPKVTEAFRERVKEVFDAYVTDDSKIGAPPNVATIAVTETRSAINDVKNRYFENLMSKNPDMQIIKRWKHNPHLSQGPRPGHADMNGIELTMDDLFEVPVYIKKKGKWERTGEIALLAHPHDPHGEPEDIINCHCDIDYIARRDKKH